MICCCDPFEPLSAEEMQDSAEMIKHKIDEKAKPASAAPTQSCDAAVVGNEEEISVEMEELLVSVILPPGVCAGQKIEVRSPDGSRTVDTVIPIGLHPGQAFLVKFPPVPKMTLTLQGSFAPICKYTPTEKLCGEGTSSALSNRETVEAVDQSPSFVQVIEDFLTPKPDPDVLAAMEKAKKDVAEAARAFESPTSDLVRTAFRDQEEHRDATCGSDRDEIRQIDSYGEQSQASKPAKSVISSQIKKVEGEAMQASVTRVSAQLEPDQNQDHRRDTVLEDKLATNQLHSSSSFVKSMEDFFTPKPNDPSSPEKADPDTTKELSDGPSFVQLQTTPNQKLIFVHVPPELLPGTTIYVEIPGENRTVAAQVPTGVTSFHVAYVPQQPLTQTALPPMMAGGDMTKKQPQVGREKLLSVRVPPGTLPGTTLHISVPDEPGRILAAQVPTGNVKKFHVSYIPRDSSVMHGSGMLPRASPYQQPHLAPSNM
ncbi:hypothetical protein MPSEU_000366700 [Mayamaea pseudoterrestris]|nr:hypothetical protein MPSEU_000366700 [Mayamaea pseudoterrestris]